MWADYLGVGRGQKSTLPPLKLLGGGGGAAPPLFLRLCDLSILCSNAMALANFSVPGRIVG